MKSCRNCDNAIHDGYYYIQLLCRLTREVVVPFSKAQDENDASDDKAQRRGNNCPFYTPERKTA
jgi:hypothetical protein